MHGDSVTHHCFLSLKVRVYTAARVEEELEAAKREYLQAAVGVSPSPAGGAGLDPEAPALVPA